MEDDVKVDVEIEKEAKQQGWVPKDKFIGPENEWIDADTFVQKGRELNPILRANNKRLMAELQKTQSDMKDFKVAASEFKQFQEDHYTQKKLEFEQTIQLLKEQKKQAIREGDGDQAVNIDDQIDSIKEQQRLVDEKPEYKQKTQDQTTKPSERTLEWIDAHPWYRTDSTLQAITDSLAVTLRNQKPFLSETEFFEELSQVVEDNISAERLGKQKKPTFASVEGRSSGTTSSVAAGKETYDHLPPDAKQACDKFVRQGLMTKEEYTKMYFE